MAQTIGDILVEEELAELYCACRNAANERLWDSKQGCYISGKDRQISIASQVWMVLGEAVTGEDARKLLMEIEQREDVEKMVTPIISMHFFIRVKRIVHSGNWKRIGGECLSRGQIHSGSCIIRKM